MHGRIYQTIDDVRDAVRAFATRYNADWLIDKNGHAQPRPRHEPPGTRRCSAPPLNSTLCPKNRARYKGSLSRVVDFAIGSLHAPLNISGP